MKDGAYIGFLLSQGGLIDEQAVYNASSPENFVALEWMYMR